MGWHASEGASRAGRQAGRLRCITAWCYDRLVLLACVAQALGALVGALEAMPAANTAGQRRGRVSCIACSVLRGATALILPVHTALL
jgi:hypothetical protein